MTDQVVDNTEDNSESEVQTQTIDDLFDAPEKSGKAKGETETKTEAKEAKADDAGAKVETAETPAAKEDESVVGLKKGISEERRKRQEAEKKAEELEARLAKAADPEFEKVPDPIDDPDGYARHLENKSNLQALKTKINLSRDILLDAKEDYPEKEKVFVELARANTHLIAQMNASPNPAKFAYQTASEHLETQKLRDPKYQDEIRAKIREEERAKLIAEQEEAKKTPAKKSALEVPNITKATAAGNNSDKVEKVDDLDDVLEGSALDKR